MKTKQMNCSFDFAAGRTDGNFCGRRRRRGRGPADGAPAAAAAAAKIENGKFCGRRRRGRGPVRRAPAAAAAAAKIAGRPSEKVGAR